MQKCIFPILLALAVTSPLAMPNVLPSASTAAWGQASAEAHLKQAESFFQIGRIGDAERHYNLAVNQAYRLGQNNPKIADVLLSAAKFHRSRGKNGRAEKMLLRAIQYKSRGVGDNHFDMTPLYVELGRLYLSEHRNRDAAIQFRKAIKLYETKLKLDKRFPNFNKREMNTKLANVFDDLARAVESTEGFARANAYRQKAGQMKREPFKDYY